MSKRKPRLEHYWVKQRKPQAELQAELDANPNKPIPVEGQRVNWRLVGANGEIMCQSTQGYRDKTDSRRGFDAVSLVLAGSHRTSLVALKLLREVGPGRKPS